MVETRLNMPQIKSWTVSDDLWNKVELLIPIRQREADRKYRRKAGAGRKPMPARQVFSAIVYVLRTGIQWKALPRQFGSASAVHQHFQNWHRAGFFQKLWQAGLAEYDGMHGIAWLWQAADGTMGKAPLATECTGRNPTDRGKKGRKRRSISQEQLRRSTAAIHALALSDQAGSIGRLPGAQLGPSTRKRNLLERFNSP
jgi:transposase